MTFHILFWALCAVLAAHVAVAIVAIAKAYRDERKLVFPNGTRLQRPLVPPLRSGATKQRDS